MEYVKSIISILAILGSFAFFIHLPFSWYQSPTQVEIQKEINGIAYKDITHAELVKEPIQYVIIYTNTSAMTMSKNDYLKIREELMRYNIIEIGG